jgi:hypothetical protein
MAHLYFPMPESADEWDRLVTALKERHYKMTLSFQDYIDYPSIMREGVVLHIDSHRWVGVVLWRPRGILNGHWLASSQDFLDSIDLWELQFTTS